MSTSGHVHKLFCTRHGQYPQQILWVDTDNAVKNFVDMDTDNVRNNFTNTDADKWVSAPWTP